MAEPDGAPDPAASTPDYSSRLAARIERSRVDIGGPLLVSGAGATYVSTDALRAYVERLAVLVDALEQGRASSRVLAAEQRAIGTAATLPPAVAAALPPVERAERDIAAALERTRSHRAGVIATAELYTQADGVVMDGIRGARGIAATLLGSVLRAAVPLALLSPATWAAVAGAVAAWNALPGTDEQKAAAIERFVREHPELLANPAFVESVRGVAMDLDNVALGALLPPPLAALIADDRFGLTGVEGSGLVLLTLASPFGLLRDSELKVRRTSSAPLAAPAQGVAQRLERVPDGDDQVRIEKYTAPGAPPRYVVYVAPTGTFSPAQTPEPWDLQSNIAGVAGLPAASFRATETAMRDAGITASDEVQFVGFSQGGLVAGMLAASGDWSSAGLETFGAPTATLGIPDDLAGMDVRHTEDFIPALAGAQPATDRLQVQRSAFATASPPTHEVVPAHQKDTYVVTAHAIDGARSDAVRGQIATMDAFTADYASRPGAELTVLTYHAERKR